MRKLSLRIGLACQLLNAGVLLCKFIKGVIQLVGGATNYLCFGITNIRFRSMEKDESTFRQLQAAHLEQSFTAVC